MTQVPIAAMTLAELRNTVLAQQTLIRELREGIEAHSRPESAVRRAMTKAFDSYNRPLQRTFGRLEAVEMEERRLKRQVYQNRALWASIDHASNPEPTDAGAEPLCPSSPRTPGRPIDSEGQGPGLRCVPQGSQ